MNKPNYGLDAPTTVTRFGICGCFLMVLAIGGTFWLPETAFYKALLALLFTAAFWTLSPSVTIILGSLYFKFRDRDWLFREVALTGREHVLDVGCGHGLLLIAAAKRLVTGKATGLDLWSQADQFSNSRVAVLRNVKLEDVLNKVEVIDGDMRKMPFSDSSFHVVVSSWAIHNIYDRKERSLALDEIIRVTKPGGRIAILDINHAREYSNYFLARNLTNVRILGPHFTFGNRTYLVLAEK
jgi:arsenite methyltransferase